MKIHENIRGFLICLVLAIILAVTGCQAGTPTHSTTKPVPSVVAALPTHATSPAPVAPAATTSQANAVEQAEDYLDYSAFSKSGLVKQLKYEGFSTADANYAIDHITVDWMLQAAKQAASYMDYSAFSRSSLIKQLKYEGFSQQEAEHGAASVGL